MFNILKGIKVLEFGGLAPGPLCGKILCDYGASVTKLEKVNAMQVGCIDVNKKSIIMDMKSSEGCKIVKRLCATSDVIIDPFRPGALEKLGLGPQDIMKENPKIIFARLTGFGQSGPLSKIAGHDINYVGLSGILSTLGRNGSPPTPPINLMADFAGGGVLCALGIVLALFNRDRTGQGQIVDSSMAEGAAYVGSWIYATKESVIFQNPRGQNMLDGGVHFYGSYETKDGKYLAVGPIEPQFYAKFLQVLGYDDSDLPHMYNFESSKETLKQKFKEKTQDEWTKIFENTDACVSPILTLDEAPNHEHNRYRNNFSKFETKWLPKASPLISVQNGVTYPDVHNKEFVSGRDTRQVLIDAGYSANEINTFLSNGTVMDASSNL